MWSDLASDLLIAIFHTVSNPGSSRELNYKILNLVPLGVGGAINRTDRRLARVAFLHEYSQGFISFGLNKTLVIF